MSWAIITKKKISQLRSFLVFSSIKSMLCSPQTPRLNPQLTPNFLPRGILTAIVVNFLSVIN